MEKYDENGNFKKEYYDESNGFWYELRGDYYYPKIAVPKQEEFILGKYGRARLNYIKNHKKGLYAELVMNGELSKHLAEIDKVANERLDIIIQAMAKKENIPIQKNFFLKCNKVTLKKTYKRITLIISKIKKGVIYICLKKIIKKKI